MSDMTDTDFDAAASAAAAIPPPPEPPPEPEPEPEPEFEFEPEVTDDGEKRYPSEVVEKLREENARRRIEARELRQVWEGYSEEQRERMEKVVRNLREDPRSAYDDLTQIRDNLRESLGIEPEEEPMTDLEDLDPQPTGERGLSEADIQRLVDERLAAAEQETRTRQIFSEALALDPKYKGGSDELFQLLRVASREGSLEKADQVLKERERGIRNEAVEEYKASLRGDHPPRVPATGSVTPKAEEFDDLDAASKAAEEMMRAQFAMEQTGTA